MTQIQTAAAIRELQVGIKLLSVGAASACIDMQIQSRPGQKVPDFNQMVERLAEPYLLALAELEKAISAAE